MKLDSYSKTLSAVLLLCALLGGSGALGQTLDGGFSAVPQVDCDQDFGNACGDDIHRSCTTPAADSRLLTGFLVQCPVGFQGSYVSNRHYVQTCGEGNSPDSWAGGYHDLVEAQAECLPLNTAVPPQTVCADRASLQTDGTCACNAGHADVDGDALACVPCPANSTVSTDGRTCVCDAGYEYDDPDDPQSCLEECPSGASRDDAGICVCSDGTEEFGGLCQVPVECRSDQVRTESNTCECPAGEKEFGGPPEFRAVPAVCEAGTVRDANQNTCACPSGGSPTDIPMGDGKGSCNICADAASSTSLRDNCTCEVGGDSPTGTWGDQDNPPRCCTSLAFSSPLPDSPPAVQSVSKLTNLQGQNLWGGTAINPPVANFQCVCVSSGRYRIEGDISIGAGSYVRVSTTIHPPPGNVCLTGTRLPSNVIRTTVHEEKHADMIVGSINDLKKQWLGQEYATGAECERQVRDLVGPAGQPTLGAIYSAYNNEVSRQNAHLDHIGEVRYYSVCSGTPGRMMEVKCSQLTCGSNWKY